MYSMDGETESRRRCARPGIDRKSGSASSARLTLPRSRGTGAGVSTESPGSSFSPTSEEGQPRIDARDDVGVDLLAALEHDAVARHP
jgi:hypothetical protein